MSPKKSQVWGVDILVAATIFFMSLFFFYNYYIDLSETKSGDIANLLEEGRVISSQLITSGYPEGWNSTNVQRIGLTENDQRINETKLLYFSEIDYYSTQKIFNIKSDYLLFFYDNEGNLTSINGIDEIGKPGVTPENIEENEDPEKIIEVSRFLIYNSTMYRMVLYLWE